MQGNGTKFRKVFFYSLQSVLKGRKQGGILHLL